MMEGIKKLRHHAHVLKGGSTDYNELFEIADEIEAEIAERFVGLPVDADGVPIHVGDELECHANGYNGTFTVFAIGNNVAVGNHNVDWVRCNPSKWFHVASFCTHVKPRTLEDVLIEYRLMAYNLYADQELTGEERLNEFKKLDAEYDSAICELLGVGE